MTSQSTLTSLPAVIFTVRDHSNPDDYGVKMSIRKHESGWELCRFKSKTCSHVRVRQAFFATFNQARDWAQQSYNCGEKFDV